MLFAAWVATLDEIHQYITGGRTPTWRDII
ncbi:VanZ family protein [Paenisporosarcina cavernae]